MVGMGRPGILAVYSADPVLSGVAPFGLACAVGTALVVDLVGGLRIPARRTLTDLIEQGPTLEELSPGRSGVAVLSGADVGLEKAVPIIERLASRWPAVVVRVEGRGWPGASVPVVPLYPGWLAPRDEAASAWQRVPGGEATPPGPGPVLPRLRARTVRRLLSGRHPGRDRWVGSWREVWDLPWA